MDSFVTPSIPIPTTAAVTEINTINPQESSDLAVIGTADDAIFAKLATVHAKYYQDPFLEYFLPSRSTDTVPQHQPQQQHQHQQRGPRRSQPPQPLQPQQHHQRHTQPIIKRGTHARVCCMDRAILAALQSVTSTASTTIDLEQQQQSNQQQQQPPRRLMIVCLGAGKDTTFFRFHAGLLQGQDVSTTNISDNVPPPPIVDWYEVDHPAVILEKIQMMERCPLLSNKWKIQPLQESGCGCSFGLVDAANGGQIRCHLMGHDLRNPPHELVQKLLNQSCREQGGAMLPNTTSTNVPVLFTMECVQMYIPDHASRLLWSTLASSFPNSCLCIYDAMIGDDPFGKMMEHNLIEAGVVAHASSTDDYNNGDANDNHQHHDNNNHRPTSTSSLLQTRTLNAQMNKLLDCGWKRVVGCDMWNAYQSVITAEQRRHANRCEFLDEVEEWMLIMRHYSVVIATATASTCTTTTTTTANNNNNNNNNKGNNNNSGNWGAHFCQVGGTSASSSSSLSPMGFLSNLCHVLTSSTTQSSS